MCNRGRLLMQMTKELSEKVIGDILEKVSLSRINCNTNMKSDMNASISVELTRKEITTLENILAITQEGGTVKVVENRCIECLQRN